MRFWRGSNDVPLSSDSPARFVPWIIGTMVFLSALVLAVALVLDSAIEHWRLSHSVRLTVEIPADRNQDEAVDAVIVRLSGLPGVVSVAPVDDAQMNALLAPWVVDDGRRWLEPVRVTAGSLQLIAGVILILIGLASIATVIVMTQTGLAVHKDTIEALHQVGARDRYVASLFQNQAFVLALLGGVPGLGLAALCLTIVSSLAARLEAPLLPQVPQVAFGADDWILLLILPLVAAVIAMLTARITVLATLTRMP